MWHDHAVLRLAVVFVLAAAVTTARADDINLLTLPGSIVAVSSTVDNAKITPEHLVDGDLGTAWNSRTGDLVGAWIAVRVPSDAHVSAIRLTAGFTKKDAHGDLFVMNQRVRTVRILRNGRE